jgi:O-antigen/teichoic acid export membrane protein
MSSWRNVAPLVAGRASSALVGLALPALLAQWLDPAAYGTYKQLFLVSNLALYSLQFGLAQSLFFFVPRTGDEAEKRAYVGQTQLVLGVIGVLAGTGLYACGPWIAARMSNPELATLAAPLALLSGALIASGHLEITLTARGKPTHSALAMTASDLVRVGAMLAGVMLGGGVSGLAWGAALAASARWVASVLICGVPRRLEVTRLSRQARYALPFGAAVLVQQQQSQLHQLYVSAHAAPEVFALYAVGCMQLPIVSLLYTPVSEMLQVRLAGLSREGRRYEAGAAFAAAVQRLARVFVPLCALLVATARPGIVALYGARYAEAAGILRVAVLSTLFASLPIDGVFKARARTGGLLVVYLAKLALTWPAVVLGFGAWGLRGAILAHVAVEGITRAVQLAIVARELEAPVFALLGWRSLVPTLAWSCAGGVGSWLAAAALANGSESRGTNLAACLGAALVMAVAVSLDLARQRLHARSTALATPAPARRAG